MIHNHEIQVSGPYQTKYPKNEACSSNSIENTKQNHCITKHRSLTYIYSCRSNLMSHWINIFSTTFHHQKVKICQNHWTTKCRSLSHIHFMWLIFASHGFSITIMTYESLNQYLQYNINPSISLQDIWQNLWTMKCRSWTHIHFIW